jgi:hypothetical protein
MKISNTATLVPKTFHLFLKVNVRINNNKLAMAEIKAKCFENFLLNNNKTGEINPQRRLVIQITNKGIG